jgi:surface polysaccharide O-acyltransferase-like enzyme
MTISPEISRRITILRFPLIVAIVLIHGGLNLDVSPLTKFVFTLGTDIFARVAVPLFFVISGWLFFIKFNLTGEDYLKKVKSRFFSLCIPYIFWNFSFLFFIFALQSFPVTASVLKNTDNFQALIVNYKFTDYLQAFGVPGGDPILLPLWFVRDLIYIVIISPIFYLLAKKIPYLSLLLFGLAIFLEQNLPFINMRLLGSMLFFYLGSLIAVKGWDLTKIDRGSHIILPTYLVIAITLATLRITNDLIWGNPSQTLINCLGVISAWCLSRKILETPSEKILINLAPFTFFVYASHEPTGMIVRNILSKIVSPSQPIVALVYYFLIPCFVVFITLGIGGIIQKYFPKVFQIITGGRTT